MARKKIRLSCVCVCVCVNDTLTDAQRLLRQVYRGVARRFFHYPRPSLSVCFLHVRHGKVHSGTCVTASPCDAVLLASVCDFDLALGVQVAPCWPSGERCRR